MYLFQKYSHILGLFVVAALLLLGVLHFSDLVGSAISLFEAVVPLFMGLCMAFILNIIVAYYERWYFPKTQAAWVQKSRRGVCICLAILSICLVIFFISWMAIPQLIHSLAVSVVALPKIYLAVTEWGKQWLSHVPTVNSAQIMENVSVESVVSTLGKLGTDSGKYLVEVMGNMVNLIFNFVIGLIFAIYILLEKEVLRRQIRLLAEAYGTPKSNKRLYHYWEVASDTFTSFIVGQFLDALILGVMVALGLWVTGVSYASTIGCVIGLTALIPLLGAYIGGLIGIIMLLAVSPWQAVLFLVVLFIMQQLEGNFIYPKIVGGSVGLPGIWVFAAITVGGSLYGVLGILFSVPIGATFYKLLREDAYTRLDA